MAQNHFQNVLDDAEQSGPVELNVIGGDALTVVYFEHGGCYFYAVIETAAAVLAFASADDEAVIAFLKKRGVSFARGGA